MKTLRKHSFSPIFFLLGLTVVIFLLFTGCKNIPEVTTESITNITTTSAVSGGMVIDDHNADVDVRGVCWNTSSLPTIENCLNYTTDGTGIGIFTSNLSGLTEGTNYYVRAYASNSEGTGYGDEQNFNTYQCPISTTNPATNPGLTTVTMNGTVNANDQSTTVTFEYGIDTNYGNIITASQNPVSGTTNVYVSANITGLTENTTYHFRVKAESSICTTNGVDNTFKTLVGKPTVTTSPVSSRKQNSAIIGGEVIHDGGSPVTARGVCWSKSTQTPTISDFYTSNGAGEGTFISEITGLIENTTYYVRAYATNSYGTGYGDVITFKTLACQEINIIPGPYLALCPLHTSGGDFDFAGHGPKVIARAELITTTDNKQIKVVIELNETETVSNWTSCYDTWEYIVYTAPNNWIIKTILSETLSYTAYDDNDHDLDIPAFVGGLVRTFLIMGDTDGNDVGNCGPDYAFISVYFNEVKFQLCEDVK